MSNSNTLEELLYEIHEKGVFDEVLDEVKQIRNEKKHTSTTDLYEMAFERVMKKKFGNKIS
jgi:hypothetical protein